MNFGARTQQLVAVIEVGPNFAPSADVVDYEAMRRETAQVAGGFVVEDVKKADRDNPRPGQIANALSPWHKELAATCSRKYRSLTMGPEGRLSRPEANQDPELLALQALRRGVRDAMRRNYRRANTTFRAPRPRAPRFVNLPSSS